MSEVRRRPAPKCPRTPPLQPLRLGGVRGGRKGETEMPFAIEANMIERIDGVPINPLMERAIKRTKRRDAAKQRAVARKGLTMDEAIELALRKR